MTLYAHARVCHRDIEAHRYWGESLGWRILRMRASICHG